jgi:GMP synthase (glutamine-hydrolysing)
MLAEMTKTAIAIRHVPFEDLGILEDALGRASYEVRYREAGLDDLGAADLAEADLLVVLGGPIGAYEEDRYPFLADELRVIERRLRLGAPTLGVCLGAQLLARALGARVYSGPTKEIGWGEVQLTDAGRGSPLRHLGGASVLHWHGDTFDLPAGAELLASTAACRNQAFRIGPEVLGLQFHAEVLSSRVEQWLIGHASELAANGVDPRTIRADTVRYGGALDMAGRRLFAEWLSASSAAS